MRAKDISLMSVDVDVPASPAPRTTSTHSAPPRGSDQGLLVFDTALKLLYMNAAARDLCGTLTAHRTGLAIHGVIPPDVLTFCDEVIQALADLTDVTERAPLQLERTAGDPARPILLRGLALPDSGDAARCRVLIFLETLKSGPAACAAENRFHLTEREQIVVGHLSEGLTNKEIASRMAISEQTVKEHFRHIMQKTDTTTRTGLLMKILRTQSPPASAPFTATRA